MDESPLILLMCRSAVPNETGTLSLWPEFLRRRFTFHFLFECDATADSPATHTESIRGRKPRGKTMPLFPYLPVIVWMGMVQAMLGATPDRDAQSVDDPANLMMNDGSIIAFPMPPAVAVVG